MNINMQNFYNKIKGMNDPYEEIQLLLRLDDERLHLYRLCKEIHLNEKKILNSLMEENYAGQNTNL